MRVLVTGSGGQLARALRTFWTDHELVLPEESRLDLTDRASIEGVLSAVRPDAVINAGAFTQVDQCETQGGLARLVNGVAVGWLAEACARLDACLIQISTDYVFDGTAQSPYREEDSVHPLSAYGESKLLGEQEARKAPEHLIVRTAWLYDAWGRNFYTTMLRLAAEGRAVRVVSDQRGAPTSCRALARQLQVALERGWRGTVHATCGGESTWHGFATEIFRLHGLRVDLSPCRTADYPTSARRPAYSVLSGEFRRRLGGDRMPEWREALAEVAGDRPTGVEHG